MNDVCTDGLSPTDAELLSRFVAERSEVAFRQLVDKHSQMVWRVCGRQLRNREDIEDAFQSTFVILARKARSVRKGSSVASWLYKVAYNQSLQLAKARSKRAEQAFVEEPEIMDNVFAELHDREQAMILDEEVSRLPEQLRSAVVLCCIEGKTRNEAAEELECTDAAIKSRLTRGRQLLRMRLARRGIGLSVVLGLLAKCAETATAAPPISLLNATVAAASQTVPDPPLFDFGNGLYQAGSLGSWLRTPLLWLILALGLGLAALGQLAMNNAGNETEVSELAIEIPVTSDDTEEKIAAILITLDDEENVAPDDARLNYLRVQREVYEQQAIAKGLEIDAYQSKGTERSEQLNQRIAVINADALKKLQEATIQLAEYATMEQLWGPDEAARVLADRSINAAEGIDDARVVANMVKKWNRLQLPGDPDPIMSKIDENESKN